MEYDDGNAYGADDDCADKVMLVMLLMLNPKHAGTPCVRDRQAELSEKSDDNYNVTCKSLL